MWGLGWWEWSRGKTRKKRLSCRLFFFHDLRMNYSCCGKDRDGMNIISMLFLDSEFHSSVIALPHAANHSKGQCWNRSSSLSWFSNTQLLQACALKGFQQLFEDQASLTRSKDCAQAKHHSPLSPFACVTAFLQGHELHSWRKSCIQFTHQLFI